MIDDTLEINMYLIGDRIREARERKLLSRMYPDMDENDAETIYQESCEDCGKVLGTFAIPKATATPTPKPTATPVPTKKPEPTKAADPTESGVVKDYYNKKRCMVLPHIFS